MSKHKHYMQHDPMDCGAACLAMVSAHYGLQLPIAKFRELVQIDNHKSKYYDIIQGAKKINLQAELVNIDFSGLLDLIKRNGNTFPFIAVVTDNNKTEHYVVVYNISKKYIEIGDPIRTRTTKITKQEFIERWQKQIITFVPNAIFQKGNYVKGQVRKFLKYIFAEKKNIVMITIITMIISVINFLGTTIFKYVIDGMSGDTPDTQASLTQSLISKISIIFQNFDIMCIVILCMYLLKMGISMIRTMFLSRTSARIDYHMTMDLFKHLVTLPFSFFNTQKTGEIMSRFNNLTEIRDALSSATFTLTLDTSMAIVFGIMLFFMSPVLFSVTLFSVCLYGIVLFVFKSHIKNAEFDVMESQSYVTSQLKESIDGIETIKTNQYENISCDKLKKSVSVFEKATYKLSMIMNAGENAIIIFLDSASIVLLMWIGAYLCASNVITIGGLFTYYYMMSYFLTPISNLIQLQPTLQSAFVAADRLNDILDTTPEQKQPGLPINKIRNIKVNHLSFSYGHHNNVINDLSMSIEQGQKIAIVGESGCGKTTFAKLLMRFFEYNSGQILVNNKELNSYSIESLREHCVYISQNTFLFADTIRNNLTLGADISDEEIKKICKMCKVDEFISKMPLGYESMLEENGSNLSGGQRQRLAIARAILKHPDLIIMDEATSNLDSITEKSIQTLINELSKDVTCIIIAHRLKTVQDCDCIYVFKSGTIVEQGTHSELMKLNNVYSSYWK